MTTAFRVGYRIALVVALAAFLYTRQYDILGGRASTVDTLAAGVLLALILLPAFREVSIGGVTLKAEVERIVQREVNKAQGQVLEIAARTDIDLLPLWEREHSSVPSDYSEKKLALLERKVGELEQLWKQSAPEERVHYGMSLRDLYWKWLETARGHWASSPPFQDVWRRVEAGLKMLGNDPRPPSR